MYDADEEPPEPEERPAYDWDAWERNRLAGRGRIWLVLMVLTLAAMTALYFTSDGNAIPWGPPN